MVVVVLIVMGDASRLGVEELAEAFRTGELTPTDAVEACLAAIDRHDARVGAWQEVYADDARACAAAATAELERARAGARALPTMFGIPFGAKDLIDVEGKRTTCGCAGRLEHPPAGATAAIVRHMIDAGAILLGKTKTVEFGRGGWGLNDSMGSPVNPWGGNGPPLVCGGSSSGSAAAVAACMVPMAIGTVAPSSRCRSTTVVRR